MKIKKSHKIVNNSFQGSKHLKSVDIFYYLFYPYHSKSLFRNIMVVKFVHVFTKRFSKFMRRVLGRYCDLK